MLAIIGILATLAFPQDAKKLQQPKIQESISLGGQFKASIEAYFRETGEFPKSNQEARMPSAELIRGNYLVSLEVDEGALQITLGNKIGESLQGKHISLRPVYVPEADGVGAISWICGYDYVPEGMLTSGKNLTNIEPGYLPWVCR